MTLLGLVFFCFLLPMASLQKCEPDNEFTNDETTTEWTRFMDDIYRRTFDRNYTKSCKGNSEEDVVIDSSSDFLWNLRFELYNESKDNRTIEACYSENSIEETCDQRGFQRCMKTARHAMLEALRTWDQQIDEELTRLAELC